MQSWLLFLYWTNMYVLSILQGKFDHFQSIINFYNSNDDNVKSVNKNNDNSNLRSDRDSQFQILFNCLTSLRHILSSLLITLSCSTRSGSRCSLTNYNYIIIIAVVLLLFCCCSVVDDAVVIHRQNIQSHCWLLILVA